MDKIENIRSIIKEEFYKKFAWEIRYAKDCQVLAISIQQKANRLISESTLKRLFGIIPSPFNPSKYTLDSLAIYLDYRNWSDLQSTYQISREASSGEDFWSRLKSRIQVVTDQSLPSIKARIGQQFLDIPPREFAVKRFDSFLNSPQVSTAFIAPGGYGKSTIVAQLTEMFFTGANPKYPDDIVCIMDGSILEDLLKLNLEIVRLRNLVEFEQSRSFSNVLRSDPYQVKGRFVLIIDSLCQIYSQDEKLYHFVENLMDIISAYKDVLWFKLLVTCTPDNWKIFSSLIQKEPHLKTLWYDVEFGGSATDSINVPLLSNNEIKDYLNKRYSVDSYVKLKFHYPNISEIFRIPSMLQLFTSSQHPEGIHTDLELLNYFVSNKILIEPYLEEKSTIISTFFQLNHYAQQTPAIIKTDLPASAGFDIAYKELIFDNVIYQYTVPGNFLTVNTYVKFSNDILMGFFLANKWIEENDFNLDLFRRVYKFYENNPLLQTNVLKFLIKIAFKEGNTDTLKDIFSIFEFEEIPDAPPVVTQVNQDIINTVGIELRKSKKVRDLLIPHYAKSKLGQMFYFESFFDMDSLVLFSGDNIDYYLANKHTDDAKVYGHFLKFMRYFLANDLINCEKEHEFFLSFDLADHTEPVLAGYYFGAQLIYQSHFGVKLDRNLIEKIYLMSETIFKKGTQSITGIPIFEYIMIFSLNYGDRFKEIIELTNLVFDKYDVVPTSGLWRHQLAMLIYVRALLNTGEEKAAIALYNQVEMKNIPINYEYYVRIRYYFIQVEFLIFENKIIEAKELIKEIKTVSQMIRYDFFDNKAILFEKKLAMS